MKIVGKVAAMREPQTVTLMLGGLLLVAAASRKLQR